MPKRSRTAKPHPARKPKPRAVSKAHRQERDEAQSAFDVMQRIIAQTEASLEGKNPAAVALGRMGGLKGGKARAASMTPAERRKSAIKAAQARWKDQPAKAKAK